MARPTPRPPRPDDLYRLRLPTDPQLDPAGRTAWFTVTSVASTFDGYRSAIWSIPTDGSAPAARVTWGHRVDAHPRPSPDGTFVAFLSDRRVALEDAPEGVKPDERHDQVQVYLLPTAGGEARRLTDLPWGVDDMAWSPDGRWLVVTSASRGATVAEDRARRPSRARTPGAPPPSDYRYLDRLDYQANGRGFVDDRGARLWLVDVATGVARRLTRGVHDEVSPAWSPDGARIVFVTNRRPASDTRFDTDLWVADVATGTETRLTGGTAAFFAPTWLADGRTVACLGHRFGAGAGTRADVWLFAADGSERGATGGRNLTARHDRMFASTMNSDVVPGEEVRIVLAPDGRSLFAIAPDAGAEELWRISLPDGDLERVTGGRHYVSGFSVAAGPRGATRVVLVRSTATTTSDVEVLDVPPATLRGPLEPRRLTGLNDDVLAELALVEPEERWSDVDGRRIQGWYVAPVGAAGDGSRRAGRRAPVAAPLVTEIHGGPHTHYGWAPVWEFQVLAGEGMGVFYCNPRGSDGYTEAFNTANARDWGDGPMRDILAGVDALVGEGRADRDRLGVTGGSYGGYMTTWIVAKDQRFRAAMTCRSVADMSTLMLTGDISGGHWARLEFGVAPWEDPDFYREISPLTYAPDIRTPLLIQHAEHDIRTTVQQAEALFTVLRSLRRPVRFMRVPGETHELTRSGTPFRRVENLVQVRDWFRWYLVEGKRRLPPKPRVRAGR